jgi:hypothetical protein
VAIGARRQSQQVYNPDEFMYQNKRSRAATQYFFGNHYIGNYFDIAKIEECLNESKTRYLGASADQKKIGLIVEYQNMLIDWQHENIIFPFLPKKHIKSFTNKSGVFMSK